MNAASIRSIHAFLALAFALSALMGCHPKSTDMNDQADFHYKLANNFFYDENPQSAIEELYRTLEIDDEHSRAHHLLGFIYFGRRDHVKALKHLQAAVSLDPKFDTAYANLGNLYLAMEQWGAAIPIFEKLLGKPLYRTPQLAHNNLGWAKLKLRRYEEARHHFEMSIFLNPKMCLAYNNLGRLHAELGAAELALERFHKAVVLCETYQEPHYFLGRLYAALEAPALATKHFRRCHTLGPDTPYGRRCREGM